jgi:hypothetical protein
MKMRMLSLAALLVSGFGMSGCVVREERPRYYHPHPVVVEGGVWVPGHYRPDGIYIGGYYR